jgi:glutaredoxin
MKKKIILSIIIFLVVAGGVTIFFLNRGGGVNLSPNGSNSDLIYFYGNGCSHCANVEKFFEENKITEKVSFQQKEVFSNTQNAQLFAEKAKICNIPLETAGVPLLWDGSKCLMGEQDIINFFKQKIGI